MSVRLHREAEQLMAEAQLFEVGGRLEDAKRRWLSAARLEAEVFSQLPTDRPRTRGIIAVSAVALFRRAGALDEAIRTAYGYLALSDLAENWRSELESLVDCARQERDAIRAGRTLGREAFEVSLRGGSVGAGLAPSELVVAMLQRIGKYALRIGEWLAGEPFRDRGPVAARVAGVVNPMVSQPVAGSFRFQLRFEAPVQLELPIFEDQKLFTPDHLARSFFEITEAITHSASRDLESIVDDTNYRTAFLKLVRNLVPDGREFRELEIHRFGGRSQATTVLTSGTRELIQRQIESSRPADDVMGTEFEGRLSGVLRALDLDKGRLWLNENGVERRHACKAAKGAILDDVVSPLVNRHVTVVGRWTPRRKVFTIHDIYEGRADVGEEIPQVSGRHDVDDEDTAAPRWTDV